jgi:hypothetical protein
MMNIHSTYNFHIGPTLQVAAFLATLCLLGCGLNTDGSEEPMKTGIAKATRPIPLLDADIPERFETATFALG